MSTDDLDELSREWEGSSPRRVASVGRTVILISGALVVLALLGVVVWARFLTGASAAPVPVFAAGSVPVAAANSAESLAPDTQAAAPSPATEGTAMSPIAPAEHTVSPLPELASPSAAEPKVDDAWLDRVSSSTGISPTALRAYAGADLELQREQPSCHLGWNTLAGIGKIESNHGRTLTGDGYSTSPILGPAVSGGQHAEGPMQFMPGTWKRWGADGNGDGVSDPNQIDDAALAAGHYLCSYGDLRTVSGWHAAVFGYNHLESYVNAVAAQATAYAQRSQS